MRSQLLHRRGRAITPSTHDGAGAPQGRARWLPKGGYGLRRGAGGTDEAGHRGSSGQIGGSLPLNAGHPESVGIFLLTRLQQIADRWLAASPLTASSLTASL